MFIDNSIGLGGNDHFYYGGRRVPVRVLKKPTFRLPPRSVDFQRLVDNAYSFDFFKIENAPILKDPSLQLNAPLLLNVRAEGNLNLGNEEVIVGKYVGIGKIEHNGRIASSLLLHPRGLRFAYEEGLKNFRETGDIKDFLRVSVISVPVCEIVSYSFFVQRKFDEVARVDQLTPRDLIFLNRSRVRSN